MRTLCIVAAALLVSLSAVYAFQMPFRVLISQEGYNNMVLPPDYKDHNEFVIGRLMYPSGGRGGRGFGGGGNWVYGGTMWSNDYPIGDRAFARIMRRLTRIDVRSVEQPINLNDGDDVYNWPWLYAAQVGTWQLTDSMIKKLQEYLERGGFFYVDDLWGDQGFATFQQTMSQILPGSQIEDIPDTDPIYHVLYDLKDKFMVANWRSLVGTGLPYHTNDTGTTVPRWRGVRDSKGRIVVTIALNSDIGDSWEHADDPSYPEKYSNMGMRISTNYAMYAMTH